MQPARAEEIDAGAHDHEIVLRYNALAWLGSVIALTIHFVLYFGGYSLFPDSTMTFANPGVTAAIAALATIPAMLAAGSIIARKDIRQSAE